MTHAPNADSDLVSHDRVPSGHIPAPRYLDLPPAVPWTRLMGPSVILAGLALGSGEYVLWPFIVSRSGTMFLWAALVGIVTQFFINMEIERWTLATGESAVAGFCRLSAAWAPVFLMMNIIPWAWPGWATGAAQLISWFIWGPAPAGASGGGAAVAPLAIASLLASGLVLTAGPVVYRTMEQIQTWLVILLLVLVAFVAAMVARTDAVLAIGSCLSRFGEVPSSSGHGLTMMQLLGALAFAGAGGTLNLSQAHYIRDKGYGMGKFVGRLTSPVTGQDEAVSGVGYLFRTTPENMARWRQWWRAANIEHFVSFLLTCVVCLLALALVTYSLLFDASGRSIVEPSQLKNSFDFVWLQATLLEQRPLGAILKNCYLAAGIAILLTTELGVLDATSRISADIVKVNFLLNDDRWSGSRLYFFFLWSEIALGSAILIFLKNEPLHLLQFSAALNGAVMFLYSLLLLYMNNAVLPRAVSMSPIRFVMIVWSCAFYGYFTFQSMHSLAAPFFKR